jgi:aerobic carbon-monoxide dehydrogenase medium subunit
MIPAPFDYHRPASVPEALALLTRYGDTAKVLSGGMSLLPLLKIRLGAAEHLIDIGRIPGLQAIAEKDGFLEIGALVTEAALERDPQIGARYPILRDTAKVIADPVVRTRATVGGNLAHGDPGNDHPATMLALGAQVVMVGPKGERTVPIDRFFQGLFTTALQPDELLTKIKIPAAAPRSGGAYIKLERKVGAKGAIARVGIGLTNLASVPTKAVDAEKFLTGKQPDAAAIAEASKLAAAATHPTADRRGSVDYKRNMARVLTGRALKLALSRAGGQ